MDIEILKLAAEAVGNRTFSCNVDHAHEIGFDVYGDGEIAANDAARAATQRLDAAGFGHAVRLSAKQGAGTTWSAFVVVQLDSHQSKAVR